MKKIAKCFVKKITEENREDDKDWLPNPHSTRTANAAREFIRYTAIDIKREG